MTTSWQAPDATTIGGIGFATACSPGLADVGDRLAHADGVNLRRGGQSADGDRNVITPSRAIDDVGEQKSPAIIFGEPALKLPAHQRVQLAILVDRPVDAGEEAPLIEQTQMLLKIERRGAGGGAMRIFRRSIEHAPLPLRNCKLHNMASQALRNFLFVSEGPIACLQ